MGIRLTEYITAIQEEGSMTRAAEKLFISESALNQQLRKLEKELGTPLFKYLNHRWVPTAAGIIYLTGAHSVIRIREQALKEIEDIRSRKTSDSEIRIAFHSTFLHFFETMIRPEYENRFPYVSLIPVVDDSRSSKKAVLNSDADIGLLISVRPDDDELTYIPIREEEFVIACSRKLLPQKYDNAVFLKKISTLDMILSPANTYGERFEKYFAQRAGLPSRGICRAASYPDMQRLLELGFAFGLLPASAAKNKDRLAAFPLSPPADYYMNAAFRKTLTITDPIRFLIILFLKHFDLLYNETDILTGFTQP